MTDYSDLDATALLAAEESGVHTRRQTEVDAIHRILAWCDLNSVDPQTQPEAIPVVQGGDRLVYPAGVGTPGVSEFALAEYAIAAHAGYIATFNRAAAALDLRHRLPRLWAAGQNLEIEPWVAKKITAMTRPLAKDAAALVDTSVAAAGGLSPFKLIELAEARVIEADPEAHRARIVEDQKRVGLFPRRHNPGQSIDEMNPEPAVRAMTLRLQHGGATEFTTTVNEIAHQLAEQHIPDDDDDMPTMDQWRAAAIELLADPHAAVAFLNGPPQPDTPESNQDGNDQDGPGTSLVPVPSPASPARTTRPHFTGSTRSAVIYLHLSEAALSALSTTPVTGLARVEGYGPMLLEQLAELLKHRHITVKPVINLNQTHAVDSYEHPATVKERTLLRTNGDVYPHSTRTSRGLDHDHVNPYQRNGPPRQTGDHNDAPLVRRHHRVKTHGGHRMTQLALGAYRWETPHGLVRVVTPQGTKVVEAIRDHNGQLIGEIYPTPAHIDLNKLIA